MKLCARSLPELWKPFSQQPVAIQVQQVALVERPIEVVEYQRLALSVTVGQTHTAAWPQTIVPGQDLGVSLQALHARWATTDICPTRNNKN